MPAATNTKRPGESRIGIWDFKNFTELASGDTLTGTPTIASNPAGLTVGAPAIVGSQVQALLTGGTDGVLYTLTATVSTFTNKTLQACGYLFVSSC